MSIDNVPEYASLYVWFAPEIKEHNPTLFESITQPSDDYMSPDLEYFWERKDSLFANDFALLKTLRSKGLNDAPYFHCFIEDDPTDLSDVDVETTLPISCYDRFFLLQSSPPLIHLAAYFNASKCFDYLMKKGANLKSTDSYNRTLDLYCIAGSNIEAFSRIEEPNIFKCLLIATSNHRNNMVEMLQSKQSTEDNLTVFGSMLHQSCGTHNIHMTLMCIKNGADINLANSNGETPLHYTANYGHFDLAKLLLAQKDINPNPQNNEINFCFFGV
ncbi:ankyrin repeat protein [Histomonas meleagridis]|uniref:ankyrin repeat protein n=1 Tax=Histomonas meleagridis TaxID=135588 RepID=UPI003559A1AD|nr:ankyrin repeat protein [Histomonas meleagridis]KAH0802561.1 ankyrin repeat protein [Histomonas meleagridis]